MACPSIVGRLDPVNAGFRKADYRRLLKDIYPGDVDPLTLEVENKAYQELLGYANLKGLKRRKVTLYNPQSLLPIVGSVGWHSDQYMGLVLSWILYKEPLISQKDSYTMQLITRRKALDLGPGQVFLFNADADHAWVSNYKCIMAQLTVSYDKSKK
jgi:hypothetical protein